MIRINNNAIKFISVWHHCINDMDSFSSKEISYEIRNGVVFFSELVPRNFAEADGAEIPPMFHDRSGYEASITGLIPGTDLSSIWKALSKTL